MSTTAMQPTSQRTQAPTSSSSAHAPTATARQYPPSSLQNQDGFYVNQAYPASSNQASRRPGRQNGHSASTNPPVALPQYYSTPNSNSSALATPYTQAPATSGNASSQISSSAVVGHSRNRSIIADQYDGPPIPPPRSSPQQLQGSPPAVALPARPAEGRVPTTRHARHNTADDRNYSGHDQNDGGYYNESVRDRPRENATTAAATAARNRRQGPATPEGPHQNASTRERGQQAEAVAQQESEADIDADSAPPPLIRENSEVINRVIVSDPQVDAERIQERIAEARPAPIGSDVTPVTGLGLVGSEGVDDGGRGGAVRRQDYSRSASRRKEVQFGDYMLGQTLGEGEFGKVKLGWKKDGSMQVAIKLIRRESVATNPSRLPKIYREISILRDLAHPNIVRLHEMVETERHIGIILEYASGGELFDYILNHRYLKDPAARRLFAQLVSGVGYLHKKGIVHRDLKLENLLLDQNRNIIITDFGFANTFNPADVLSDEIEYNLSNREFVRKYRLDRQDEKGMRKGDLMQTSCGSPCYAAPELVVSDSLYTGRKVDVWSCGVILYAMLAGYLPFDDDPANPEGDNINLLYKYITSTPLTFPEYITPHARDLLRRILVPNPRKRADLFEVARHSWLSEYHHVVSHITSSTTAIADIQNSTVRHEDQLEPPLLNRSASVREPSRTPSTTSPSGALSHPQANVTQNDDVEPPRSRSDRNARHTLQPEYVAPQSHTARGEGSAIAASEAPRARAPGSRGQTAAVQPESSSKPLPQTPAQDSGKIADYPVTSTSEQKMPPPTRPPRDVPRSVSDSTGAFGGPHASQNTSIQQVTRPSTGGSMTSVSGPSGTRSDIRLPSRGSYGQPVAPTVAATNVQGRVTKPTNGRGYSISGPVPQQGQQSVGPPTTQPLPSKYNETPAAPPAQPTKNHHHRRTSTLSGLGERLFGRSGSVMKKQERDLSRPNTGKKYPPTSMKDHHAAENPSRPSMDSKRSFTFGLAKKKSVDLESRQDEKSGRRFSLLPASVSLKGKMGGSKDQDVDLESPTPQPSDFPQPPTSTGQSRPTTAQHPQMNSYDVQDSAHHESDGQYDQRRPVKVNNFSRPPPQQYQQHQKKTSSSQAPNDVYGGTGVYAPTSQYPQPQGRSYLSVPTPPVETEPRRPHEGQPQYAEGFNDYDRPHPSMQQGRQGRGPAVLQKPNRKFVDAYTNEQGPTHHEGSSGPAKKVMDFFRRRGRARTDEYR